MTGPSERASPPSCPRLFEVEAMRDGRLGDAERVSFARHLSVCPRCSREAKAFETLAAAVRAPAALGEADELHVRRERTRLLAAFDAAQITNDPPSHRPRRAISLAFAVVALAAAIVVVGARTGEAPAVSRAPSPTPSAIVVHADSEARYAKRTEGNRETIILERGALRIQVTHPRGETLRVALPDGELEDIGTTFTVEVIGGRTARVAVEEGSVVLRLRGSPPVHLGAGDRWPSPFPTPPAAPAVSSAPGPVTSASSRAGGDAADELRAAMAALDDGDARGAAARFARFGADHPQDPRSEDAAYLRVIALQRTGDEEATRRAARDYLVRYPGGFRRAEVERLAP